MLHGLTIVWATLLPRLAMAKEKQEFLLYVFVLVRQHEL